MVKASGRIRLFQPKEEFIMIALPLVFLPLAVGDFFFHWITPDRFNIPRLSFVQSFVFMDVLHVGLTYPIVACLPEFQKWCAVHGGGSVQKFHLRMLALFLCLGVLFFLGGAKTVIQDPPTWRYVLNAVVLPIMCIVPHFHTMWQNRGISFAYHRKVLDAQVLTESEIKTVKHCEEIERLGFMTLYFSWAASIIASLGIPFRSQEPLWSPIPQTASIRDGAFIICLASVLLILAATWVNPVSRRSFKPFYVLRLIFWPMTLQSFPAIFGICAGHGTEYFIVYRKMCATSDLSDEKRRRVAWISFLACATLALTWLPGYFTEWTLSRQILSSIGYAAAYVHYYLDRNVFQMRDPLNRETAGHLLLGASGPG